ncbi:hypothetical protein HCG51_08830 [Tolypothrix sp. PCC 7910]|uniref:hypothetical protein n=1 Tax=Tolypothrix sp. PCC 7910 TaxID=2099387 RepID=UPI001427812F|nr:hypothetical protein [Tolypothrix sp. PCC 7910]QIR36834.1 hypothetical protein HCG51_08830 [Tolypothrix sp. PCC 7910]
MARLKLIWEDDYEKVRDKVDKKIVAALLDDPRVQARVQQQDVFIHWDGNHISIRSMSQKKELFRGTADTTSSPFEAKVHYRQEDNVAVVQRSLPPQEAPPTRTQQRPDAGISTKSLPSPTAEAPVATSTAVPLRQGNEQVHAFPPVPSADAEVSPPVATQISSPTPTTASSLRQEVPYPSEGTADMAIAQENVVKVAPVASPAPPPLRSEAIAPSVTPTQAAPSTEKGTTREHEIRTDVVRTTGYPRVVAVAGQYEQRSPSYVWRNPDDYTILQGTTTEKALEQVVKHPKVIAQLSRRDLVIECSGQELKVSSSLHQREYFRGIIDTPLTPCTVNVTLQPETSTVALSLSEASRATLWKQHLQIPKEQPHYVEWHKADRHMKRTPEEWVLQDMLLNPAITKEAARTMLMVNVKDNRVTVSEALTEKPLFQSRDPLPVPVRDFTVSLEYKGMVGSVVPHYHIAQTAASREASLVSQSPAIKKGEAPQGIFPVWNDMLDRSLLDAHAPEAKKILHAALQDPVIAQRLMKEPHTVVITNNKVELYRTAIYTNYPQESYKIKRSFTSARIPDLTAHVSYRGQEVVATDHGQGQQVESFSLTLHNESRKRLIEASEGLRTLSRDRGHYTTQTKAWHKEARQIKRLRGDLALSRYCREKAEINEQKAHAFVEDYRRQGMQYSPSRAVVGQQEEQQRCKGCGMSL